LRIVGEGLPTIRYRSTLDAGQVALDRAGIYATDCEDLTIEGLRWEGDNNHDLAINQGVAVYLRGCKKATLRRLHLKYGAALFQQDPLDTDRGLLVADCHSYGHRMPCIPGPYSRVEHCSWELPADPDWDRVGTTGSSHAIYLYAGRDHVTVDGCSFLRLRTHGVKASGSALPITHMVVEACRFEDCGGGVLFGSDRSTDPEHTDALISSNLFVDCANRGAGWFEGATISVYGSKSVRVVGNKLLYSRAAVTPAACKGIEAIRYYYGSVGGRLNEDLLIAENEIIARAPGITPGSILTHGIYMYETARARVERNLIDSAAGVGITLNPGCSLARVRANRLQGTVSAVQAFSAQGVEVSGTRLVRGAYTSTNPQIRYYTCTGVDSSDNFDLTTTGHVPMTEQVY
jgi:hypothetical protein